MCEIGTFENVGLLPSRSKPTCLLRTRREAENPSKMLSRQRQALHWSHAGFANLSLGMFVQKCPNKQGFLPRSWQVASIISRYSLLHHNKGPKLSE